VVRSYWPAPCAEIIDVAHPENGMIRQNHDRIATRTLTNA
jgi:hypothetical protein